MRAQLRHLIEASALPNVSLQVLPFHVGGHATAGQLAAVAEAWRERGKQEGGGLAVLHGEILCRKDV